MLDFQVHGLRPGDWLLVEPAQVHRFDVTAPWNGWLLVFTQEAIVSAVSRAAAAGLLESLVRRPLPWRLTPAQHANVLRILSLMRADSSAGFGTDLVNGLLCGALSGLLQRLAHWQEASGGGTGAALHTLRYRRFLDILESGFRVERRVEAYAEQMGLTERTLNRACHAAAGRSVKACIRDRIVLEAKRLLVHDDRPVQWIADHLGFTEPTNFTKTFREATGVSPTTFRRRTQGPGGGAPA